MIGFVTIWTNDMERAKAFYDTLLWEIGGKQTIDIERVVMWSNWEGAALAVAKPFDKEAAEWGNGNMAAIAVASTDEVDRMYAKALELWATDEWKPGERIPGFYAWYFRDLDGNKLNFFNMAS